ncbi:hypothetical protein BD779DRAFT_1785234, partial [Infundibulicybe gibba]
MILLYRCWIIWDRRWAVVAVPGFLALITLGGDSCLLASSIPPRTTDTGDMSRLYMLTGITTYSISLVVNALATLLIVSRILSTSRRTHPVLDSNTHQSFRVAIAMLIESGLLMLAFQLAFVILFAFQMDAAFCIVSDLITPIYGITPTLLNIQVAMGSAMANQQRRPAPRSSLTQEELPLRPLTQIWMRLETDPGVLIPNPMTTQMAKGQPTILFNLYPKIKYPAVQCDSHLCLCMILDQ